jgi:hypothetical protein
MNLKKGLLRIWIVSLPIVFGWGYFSEVRIANQVSMTWYGFHQDAIKELSNPICREIVEKKPEKFPKLGYPNPCIQLSIFWNDIRSLRMKDQIIQANDIEALYEKNWQGYAVRQGLTNATLNIALYHILIAIIAIIFYVFRWIARGFKQDDLGSK